MDFKVIDEMGPYRLVINDEDLVGLIDAEGNVCVPCEMDDVFESGDDDYCLMGFIKDGKYGLLLPDGKYVEPVYDDFMTAIIEGEFSVHVCEGDVYGFYAEPEYEYRIVGGREKSLFALHDDDLSDDAEDDFDLDGIDWDDIFGSDEPLDVDEFIEERRAKAQELHEAGYALAELVWVEKYANQEAPDMKAYTEEVISKIKGEGLGEFSAAEAMISGAVAFMSEKCLANVDLPKLNRKIQKYINEDNESGYWSLMFGLMEMFERPDYGEMKGRALSIPTEMRPAIVSPSVPLQNCNLRIGRLYVAEHGMHMYRLCADLYDYDDPEKLVEENCILGNDNVRPVSELIQLVQQLKDPDKTNEELSRMLEKAKAIEAEECYGHILSDHGMYAFYDEQGASYLYVYVYEGVLYAAESLSSSFDVISVRPVTPTEGDFSGLLDELKADINIAAMQLRRK